MMVTQCSRHEGAMLESVSKVWDSGTLLGPFSDSVMFVISTTADG